MRRTPVTEQPDEFMDDEPHESVNLRRISTAPGDRPAPARGEGRYRRSGRWSQSPPRRQGPDARAWLLRAVLGLCTLAAIWLALQWLFPVAEQQATEARPRAETPVPSQVGAPEPPPAAVASKPAATLIVQAPPPAVEGDRLPGLPTPAGVQAPQPTAGAAQPPSAAAPEQSQSSPPTLAPIPPPEGTPSSSAAPQTQPPPPNPTQPPPPAAPAGSNGPLQLKATASPANPLSENAVVTISLNLTANGAPLAGAQCMSTVYFRTATVRQPMGGVTTGPGGAASFQVDAKGATYNRYIPVDVTCTSRQGSVTARTGFTPVRGR